MRLIMNNVEKFTNSEAVAQKLIQKGFHKVSENPTGTAKPQVMKAASPAKLSSMKVDELRSLAKENGLEGYSSLSKEELVTVLKDVMSR